MYDLKTKFNLIFLFNSFVLVKLINFLAKTLNKKIRMTKHKKYKLSIIIQF